MIEEVIFLPEASADLTEARGWYESRDEGLGAKFLARVDECVLRMQQNPNQYKRVYKDYHAATVRQFPYRIFYSFGVDRIIVYAVFHSAQDPAKWRKRLR